MIHTEATRVQILPAGINPSMQTSPWKVIPPSGQMRVPVRIISAKGTTIAPEQESALVRIASLPVVEHVVALPDLHTKPDLEAPSSLAVALRDHIALSLSSPSPNCGIALASTGLFLDDLSDSRMDVLFNTLAQRLPLKAKRPPLTKPQVVEVLARGAEAAVELYSLPEETLLKMEQGGNALRGVLGWEIAKKSIRDLIPSSLMETGRRRFAQVGAGNHFLEMQVIESIHEPSTAAAWNLQEGQIVVMYHSDSGLLGALTGRLYAYRRKNTRRGRLWEWRVKLPFHFRHGRLVRLPYRLKRYFSQEEFQLLQAGSEEGQRAWLALQAASNYAYANRAAILAVIRDAIRQQWEGAAGETRLIWDAPHNSILPEQVNGEELWIHRHNASRVLPPSQTAPGSPYHKTGHPVLLPGTERNSSYLCAAGEGSVLSLFSADHGAGLSALNSAQPLSKRQSTRLYGYKGEPARLVPHLSDHGVDEVMETLRECQIALPVATLRPLAVLKG